MRSVSVLTLFLASCLTAASAGELSVDLGRARAFDERFNTEVRRIGFDVRPAAARPTCTTGEKVTCNMRVGSTMAVIIGTDRTGQMARDVSLVKVGGEEGVAWINAMTALIAMFEPKALPTEVRDALKVLTAPLSAGKTEFSTSHDMSSTHMTMNVHPLMGIVMTLDPR